MQLLLLIVDAAAAAQRMAGVGHFLRRMRIERTVCRLVVVLFVRGLFGTTEITEHYYRQ